MRFEYRTRFLHTSRKNLNRFKWVQFIRSVSESDLKHEHFFWIYAKIKGNLFQNSDIRIKLKMQGSSLEGGRSMSNAVKALCEKTQLKLKDASAKLEQFLNHHTLPQLNADQDEVMQAFYKGYLADLRHLLVMTDIVYEKIGLQLRRPQFNEEAAEKALYETYHQSVNAFYYPKHECYSEDGRYAYTGQDAIRFRKIPVKVLRDVTIELSKLFEVLREELSYYESDYVTQKRMQGEKIGT